MELPQLTLDTYIALGLVIATPWLIQTFSLFSSQKSSKTRTEQLISTAVLAHTLYLLYYLLVSPPQNVFKALQLPLSASPESLRSGLGERFGGEQYLPEHLNVLLKRLGLMDLRSLYVRFGHDVLTTCSYCQSFEDFALFALPSPLLQYIGEIAFVGLLTLPSSRTSNLRPLGLGVLLAAAMAEAYWVLTVPVLMPTRGTPVPTIWWHDNFVQLRHLLFLALPIVISFLPYLHLHRVPILSSFVPPPENAAANLPRQQFQMQGQNFALPANITLSQVSNMTLRTLGHLVPTLHLLKYSHAAIMRSQSPSADAAEGSEEATPAPASRSSPSLHARATEWWRGEAFEGDVVRNDENVRTVLKSVGLSLEEERKEGDVVAEPEGPLLTSVKIAVNNLKQQGAPPSEHWVF